MLTPDELVAEATEAALEALAITDHDIIDGVAPAMDAARGTDLEIVPGVEFSSNIDGHEIHVLGLFIDHTNEELVASTVRSRQFRLDRAAEIVDRLHGIGVDIDLATVEAAGADGSVGRPHIAQALVQHGQTKTLDEGFKRYIGIGRPAFVPKPTLDAPAVIDVVHGAGGVAILAHPASSRVNEDKIRRLAAQGLDGFEINHPKHSSSARRKLTALIEDLGLLPSGGSDFHGPGSGRTKLGAHAVPLSWMQALRTESDNHRNGRTTTEGVT